MVVSKKSALAFVPATTGLFCHGISFTQPLMRLGVFVDIQLLKHGQRATVFNGLTFRQLSRSNRHIANPACRNKKCRSLPLKGQNLNCCSGKEKLGAQGHRPGGVEPVNWNAEVGPLGSVKAANFSVAKDGRSALDRTTRDLDASRNSI